jgi:hypothetical protein
VIRACIDFCLDFDASLRLPIAQKRLSAAEAEQNQAMAELERIKTLVASDRPETATPLSLRTPPPASKSTVFVNPTGPGNNRLEGQVEHDHGQFLRLIENWDTLGERAKAWVRRQAAEHPTWLIELDPEHQQLVLTQSEATGTPSHPIQRDLGEAAE